MKAIILLVVAVVGAVSETNIAKGKPTQQSSTWRKGHVHGLTDGNTQSLQFSPALGSAVQCVLWDRLFDAEFAVDGNVLTMQHTDVHDEYPWWRVDLLDPYRVQKVRVYSRPAFEQRFHDVAIFVSNEDIAQMMPWNVFNPGNDSICVENIGSKKAVGPKWTTFECKQAVVGKFVSIQITADCAEGREDCNYDEDHKNHAKKHLLQMMEVEVYGEIASKA